MGMKSVAAVISPGESQHSPHARRDIKSEQSLIVFNANI
jgi:hypothetical protein